MTASFRIERLTGPHLREVIPQLADLRISIFRDFPYLYQGTHDYEAWYLGEFAKIEGAVVIAALEGDQLIGAATAAPLKGEHAAFQSAFRKSDYAIEDIFYFSESVLLPAYRGRGIGHMFFDHREDVARKGGFSSASFCAVIRSEDHPLKPVDYRSLEPFWTKRGYRKIEGLICPFSWQDVNEAEESSKLMQFWLRRL